MIAQHSNVRASTLLQQDNATRLINNMTPEERIGQLFVITFRGHFPVELEDVVELITEHHISVITLTFPPSYHYLQRTRGAFYLILHSPA